MYDLETSHSYLKSHLLTAIIIRKKQALWRWIKGNTDRCFVLSNCRGGGTPSFKLITPTPRKAWLEFHSHFCHVDINSVFIWHSENQLQAWRKDLRKCLHIECRTKWLSSSIVTHWCAQRGEFLKEKCTKVLFFETKCALRCPLGSQTGAKVLSLEPKHMLKFPPG